MYIVLVIVSDKEKKLKVMSENKRLKNPKLEKLKQVILENYSKNQDARIIVFVKTRELTVALENWMEETPELKELKAKKLTGSNAPAVKGGMRYIGF